MKDKKKIIIAAAAPVVLVLCVLGILIIGNLNAAGKVASALSKTVSDFKKNNKLVGALNASDITKDGEYTALVELKTEITELGDIQVNSEIAVNNEEIGISGYLDLTYIPIINYELQLDDKQLRAQFPLLNDYLFTYNYHEKNDGFLMEKVDAELLNDALAQFHKSAVNNSSKEEFGKVLWSSLQGDFKDIRFSKEGKEKYIINGKEHYCKGYSAILSKEEIDSITGILMNF